MNVAEVLDRMLDCAYALEYNKNEVNQIDQSTWHPDTKKQLKSYHLKRIKKCQKRIKLLNKGLQQLLTQPTQ